MGKYPDLVVFRLTGGILPEPPISPFFRMLRIPTAETFVKAPRFREHLSPFTQRFRHNVHIGRFGDAPRSPEYRRFPQGIREFGPQ